MYVLHENKITKNINPENFLQNAKQEVPLENTTTWKIKFLTSSLDLCVLIKLAKITMLEASKLKQKSSVTDRVHQNGAEFHPIKPNQTSKMKLLAKVFNDSRDVFRTVFSIQNVFRTSRMVLFTKIMIG